MRVYGLRSHPRPSCSFNFRLMNESSVARSIKSRRPIMHAGSSFDQMACRMAHTAQEQYAAACFTVKSLGVIDCPENCMTKFFTFLLPLCRASCNPRPNFFSFLGSKHPAKSV